MMSRRLKVYDITFRSNLFPTYNVVNPYDEFDIENISNGMKYVFKEGKSETVRVKAPSKKIAESLLAIKLFQRVMGLGIEGGYKPYVIDALRNIESIDEVTADEE